MSEKPCNQCGATICGLRLNGTAEECRVAFIPRRRRTGYTADPFPPMYPGLDERESLNEWIGEHFETESDFVGFDVGAQ